MTHLLNKTPLDSGQHLSRENLTEFERGLLESINQMQRAEFAVTHTPEQILARRAGRPKGSIKEPSKKATTLRLDCAVLESWQATGKGWQTRAAAVLAAHAPK